MSLRGLAAGLIGWYTEHGRHFPWREEPRDPWHVLLAEVLLRQTSARHVLKVYDKLIALAPNPTALVALPEERLMELLRPLGLQTQRAIGLWALATAIHGEHGGRVPRTPTSLLQLPHVGPYAAGAVLVFSYAMRAPLPDVNVGRVGSRYFGEPPPNTKAQLLRVARRVLRACPKGKEQEYFYGLLDLAAEVCRPKPRCDKCPLSGRCMHRRREAENGRL